MNIDRPVIDPTERDTEEHRADIPVADTSTIQGRASGEMETVHPDEASIPRGETEPHGMYWHRSTVGGPLTLRAHPWFYEQVRTTAELILAEASQQFAKDEQLQAIIYGMASALREYVGYRTAINEMAGARKFKIEADDACYQFCQAAKYYIDATEKAQFRLSRGEQIDEPQINKLKELSQEAMREGYALTQAVIQASNVPPAFDFRKSTERVVDYSCRKLTEWFAKRRVNQEQQNKLTNEGAQLELKNFFKSILGPRSVN